MDPSRIRLEDDRFGLIGAAFRPGNRAAYAGRRGDDYVWSISIIVGPDDDIQTVEIDDHGAKSSRMLSSGERFDGLDILAASGTEAYIIAGTFTLMGMELSAADQGTTRDFADILRSAADDHSWRLPLRVVGHPRDLQLSAQGRDILRETAATLERDGTATTSLAAARRLELSEPALDSIRRRISRTSLQAYRMHGRWYVVLDNLARSRATPSVVEEAPEAAEEPIAAEAATEPVSTETMPQPEMSGAPTEDDLAAFAEPEVAEPEAPAAEAFEPEPPAEPGVEYVEEEPLQEAAESITAAETGATEPTEPQMEAVAFEADDVAEPEIEAAAEAVETPSEPVIEESGEAEAELEEAPVAEPETTEDYRVAATTASPASQVETDEAENEVTEQATEASVEDLATASVYEAEAGDEAETIDIPVVEDEQPQEQEAGAAVEPSAEAPDEVVEYEEARPLAEAELEPAEAPESIEAGPEIQVAPELADSEPDVLAVETAASIEEPIVAEDLSAIEATLADEPAPAVEESIETEIPAEEVEVTEEAPESAADLAALETTVDEQQAALVEEAEDADVAVADLAAEADAEVPEMAAAEPEVLAEEPAEDNLTIEAESPAEPVDEAIVEESIASVEEPVSAAEEPAAPAEPEIPEQVQSEEALLFADMVKHAADEAPVATELEADVAEQSDQLIAERIGEAPAAENGEVEQEISDALDESEIEAGNVAPTSEPSDELIAEGIRTHAPAYADEVGRDELIESAPAADEPIEPEAAVETESVEAEDVLPHAEAGEAEAEAPEAEPEQSGGQPAASYFADARGGAETRQAPPPPAPADIATHLRGEVAFLRQQSREKDRQIGVWGDGAKWLQPFVDQIRSLEKQVERLGELQVQRENERISDLISERDGLRQRLEALETQIVSAQTASTPTATNRRSWFRRMMGSE